MSCFKYCLLGNLLDVFSNVDWTKKLCKSFQTVKPVQTSLVRTEIVCLLLLLEVNDLLCLIQIVISSISLINSLSKIYLIYLISENILELSFCDILLKAFRTDIHKKRVSKSWLMYRWTKVLALQTDLNFIVVWREGCFSSFCCQMVADLLQLTFVTTSGYLQKKKVKFL